MGADVSFFRTVRGNLRAQGLGQSGQIGPAGTGRRASGVLMEPRPDGDQSEQEELLTPSEVAAMFRVNPKTVTRWARSGKISAIRTLGGHRRFRKSEITRILAEGGEATGH